MHRLPTGRATLNKIKDEQNIHTDLNGERLKKMNNTSTLSTVPYRPQLGTCTAVLNRARNCPNHLSLRVRDACRTALLLLVATGGNLQ